MAHLASCVRGLCLAGYISFLVMSSALLSFLSGASCIVRAGVVHTSCLFRSRFAMLSFRVCLVLLMRHRSAARMPLITVVEFLFFNMWRREELCRARTLPRLPVSTRRPPVRLSFVLFGVFCAHRCDGKVSPRGRRAQYHGWRAANASHKCQLRCSKQRRSFCSKDPMGITSQTQRAEWITMQRDCVRNMACEEMPLFSVILRGGPIRNFSESSRTL